MSYQALYRVWRPQSFDDLVGQTFIAQTLKNAVQQQQLSHAYLFTGPRGTGKTSAAKILAKAVNCPHHEQGNPCNQCDICRAITQGELADVLEIDAASNNGVDEIRELRENVKYAPTQTPYKVYIIDEVHMLTTGAFNALLKTLEEPPAHVIFILATTEPHKIPATIMSRTQRFDFQRISQTVIQQRLTDILNSMSISYEEPAIITIARSANGGLRDALSLLDQALSYDQSNLTQEVALEVCGSVSHDHYFHYLNAILQKQSIQALEMVQEIIQKGKEPGRYIEELIAFLRDVLLSVQLKDNFTLLDDELCQTLQKQVSVEWIVSVMDELSDIQQAMRLSHQPQLMIEVMTIQLSQREFSDKQTISQPSSAEMEHLKNQIAKLEEELAQLKTQLQQSNQTLANTDNRQQKYEYETERERPTTAIPTYQQDIGRIYGILDRATRVHITRLKQTWDSIKQQIPPKLRMLLNQSTPLAAGESVALISIENQRVCARIQQDQETQEALIKATVTTIQEPIVYVFIAASQWKQLRENYRILKEQGKINAQQHVDFSQEIEDLKAQFNTQTPEVLEEVEVQLVEPELPINHEHIEENMQSIESKSDEPSIQTDYVVQKAIDIFGEDNLKIYYDQ